METTEFKPKYAHDVLHSWGEFLDFAIAGSGKHGLKSSKDRDESFTGTESWDQCLEIARNGWAEGEARTSAISATILDKVTGLIEHEQVVYDVEGIGLDVATYLNGEPECWQRFDTEITEGQGTKHVKIVFNATVSGGISKNIIEARGATVAALVQALEFAGTRVELWVLAICTADWKSKGPDYEARVLVKAADQELDMSRVAFALAHPSMLRRLGFACMESHEVAAKELSLGYGNPQRAVDKGDLYIDSGTLGEAQWEKTSSAVEWVLKQLTAQGVHLAAPSN